MLRRPENSRSLDSGQGWRWFTRLKSQAERRGSNLVNTLPLSPEVAYGYAEYEPDSCFMFHGDVLLKMLGPVVYIARTPKADGILYIGSSKSGMGRISDEAHASLREALKVPDSRLVVVICKSEAHARDLESEWILFYQPTLNKVGKKEPSKEFFDRFPRKSF